ncbi:FAST kinase domain-containing protein 5, mitochondrial isoform X1 [Scophthalmus maximus]|uniref:FAST kinase domain-containing protein 5, mitochondrial isoform X1 n=1 Tax=Scophthalmus maximus TaxID=52904 RepID=UPI001FA90C66|nr:FAST kinase domain-containing protein 5, mitochondrial isoform X1 [Scophthalmus maximus]
MHFLLSQAHECGILMAACVRCQRVAWLRYLPGLRNAFTQSQHLYGKTEDETDAQEGKKGASQHQEASLQGGSRLYYKPSSYHHSVWMSAASWSQTVNDEDEQCLYTLAPPLWRQSNRYSVSCLRHLSSSENTPLDLTFEPEMPSVSPYSRKPMPTDVRVDTRGFLKCRPEYASMTLDLNQRPPPLEWEDALAVLQKVAVLKGSMKPSDVSQFLVELSRLHPNKMSLVKNNQRFVMLLRYSVVNLRLFTDLQLLELLQSFVWLDMPPAHPLLGLYETELSRRANQMTLHQLLLAADLWRCIKRPVPQFLQHLYDKIHPDLGFMGIPELVHLLYIVGECRQFPEGFIHPVQQLLMRHLQQLYPEEVGSVCLGLFKSHTSLSQSAVTCIVDKAHSSVKEMSDFAMVNVLKLLRFSFLFHRAWMQAMTHEVPLRAPRMGVKGLMHVALTCSSLHYRNDKILLAVAKRVPSLVSHCRSKDSCKLLWAFGTFGFLPVQNPSFYPSLTEALRQKKAEFEQYPHHLLTGLLGLAFASQFPEDLIALALSPGFVNFALKSTKVDLKTDLLTLDGTVALELPHWTGPRLSRELREEVAELLWKLAQSDVCRKPEVQEAESILQHLLGGEEFVHKRMILPHTRSIDLEVHIDSTGQPIPVNPAYHTTALIPENSSPKFTSNQGSGKINEGVAITEKLLSQLMNSKRTTEPLTPSPMPTFLHRANPGEGALFDNGLNLTSDLIKALTKPSSPGSAPPDANGRVKLAIQVSLRNHQCCNSQQLIGIHAMKRRQLKLAGYKVVEISHSEWFPMLGRSRTEKLEYMHCKVYDSQ